MKMGSHSFSHLLHIKECLHTYRKQHFLLQLFSSLTVLEISTIVPVRKPKRSEICVNSRLCFDFVLNALSHIIKFWCAHTKSVCSKICQSAFKSVKTTFTETDRILTKMTEYLCMFFFSLLSKWKSKTSIKQLVNNVTYHTVYLRKAVCVSVCILAFLR